MGAVLFWSDLFARRRAYTAREIQMLEKTDVQPDPSTGEQGEQDADLYGDVDLSALLGDATDLPGDGETPTDGEGAGEGNGEADEDTQTPEGEEPAKIPVSRFNEQMTKERDRLRAELEGVGYTLDDEGKIQPIEGADPPAQEAQQAQEAEDRFLSMAADEMAADPTWNQVLGYFHGKGMFRQIQSLDGISDEGAATIANRYRQELQQVRTTEEATRNENATWFNAAPERWKADGLDDDAVKACADELVAVSEEVLGALQPRLARALKPSDIAPLRGIITDAAYARALKKGAVPAAGASGDRKTAARGQGATKRSVDPGEAAPPREVSSIARAFGVDPKKLMAG